MNKNFSKFGAGRRTLFPNMVCAPEDNFIPPDNFSAFWKDADNSDMLTVEDDRTVKISANGKRYVKWFSVKPNTSYFLSFFGKTDISQWTDLNFGILGEDGLPFENHHTKAENDFYVFREGQDQTLTVKGQDGEWYRRTYMFSVFDTEKVGFFAEGTCGTVFLNRVYLCKASKIRNSESRRESIIFNSSEDVNDCLPQNNIIKDLTPFKNGENYGSFITVSNNSLNYSYGKKGCYYFAWLPLEDNRIYTFVYSDEVKQAGKCVYGFIAEDASGRRKWISNKTAKNVHMKETTSDAVAVVKGERIAFAVYDGGGEAEFSDFKIFFMGDGIVS